jgi:hypothetical protein
MSVPHWLAQHLVDAGHWDVAGVGRNARGRRCRDCGDWVLAGLDADRCAEVVYVDPTPLTALGEAMAHIAGLSTYALRREGPGFRLDHRSRWHIAGTPAGSPGQRHDVVSAHQCSAPEPGAPLVTESVLQRQSVRDHHDLPPY